MEFQINIPKSYHWNWISPKYLASCHRHGRQLRQCRLMAIPQLHDETSIHWTQEINIHKIGNNTSTTICLFVFVYSYNKVNRSLAIYSPRTTTTNQQGHQMNRPICAQERIFWAKFGLSWAKNPNFNKRKQKLCHPHNRKNTWAPCSHCFSVSMGHNWPYCAKIPNS